MTTIERAFALARSGECANLDEIRRILKRERFDQVEAHLSGAAIGRQLKELCREARERPDPAQAGAEVDGN